MKTGALRPCNTGISRRFFPLLLLGALTESLIPSAPARAQAPVVAGSAIVVEGTAVTKDGHPLANATIYLNDLPSEGSHTTDTQMPLVTDGSGHFVWKPPRGYPFRPDGNDYLPKCWMLSSDRSEWTISLRPAAHMTVDSTAGPILRSATRECVTRWIRKGTSPLLSVVALDTAIVRIQMRDPDGKALREHSVEVYAASGEPNGFGALVYEGKTDNTGMLEMRCFAGVSRLQVFAPGIGFTSTGILELPSGKKVDALVPAMAPFARLSGSTDVSGSGLPCTIALVNDGLPEHWYRPTITMDAAGHWTIEGVLPGRHRIVLSQGDRQLGERIVTVQPGETQTGIQLAFRTVGGGANARARSYRDAFPTSVAGTVKRSDGQPAADAVVYAICPDNQIGGWGWQQVLKATTDDTGHYVIAGLPEGGYPGEVRLIASSDGSGVAEASPQYDLGATDKQAHADLILPPPTTGLTVRILKSGQPVAGAAVTLSPTNDSILRARAFPGHPPKGNLAEVERLFRPSAVTNANGQATFNGLFPGLWDVTATDGPDANDIPPDWRISWPAAPRSSVAFGIAHNIDIRSGKIRDFTLHIDNQTSNQAAFRVVGPDGRAPLEAVANIESGPAVPSGSGGGPSKLDIGGDGVAPIGSAGLWRVMARFRDIDMNSFSARSEPFYAGQTVFANSPAMPLPERVVIHAVRRGPGSLHFRVVDAAGKPTRAAITLGSFRNVAEFGGSTDRRGEIDFAGMPSGSYNVFARIVGAPEAPALGDTDAPFPNDSDLIRSTLILPQGVIVAPDSSVIMTLRAAPQGYIRGWLRVSGLPAEYSLGQSGYSLAPPRFRVDPVTGQFVAGPFPVGKTTLTLSGPSVQPGVRGPIWEADVNVVADTVAHVTLIPEGSATMSETTLAATEICRMHRAKQRYPERAEFPFSGTVFLPDGFTPAWGARVAVSVPDSRSALVVKRTDISGQLTSDITPRWEPYQYESLETQHETSPEDAVLIAWLPGSNGAVVLPYTPDKPIRAVLTNALELRGRVTVGRTSVAGNPSTFKVVASYLGRGRLDRLMNVETTAQDDGSFVLAGLTPGTYRVQAARDGIWLSDVWTVTIGAASGASHPDLALDIAPPGQVLDLRLVNAAGKPLPGAVVLVTRPDGPLTDQDWPEIFTADGAGELHLEGLNAGQETLAIYSAPAVGTYDYNRKPERKPLTTIVTNVPAFVVGAPAVTKTITCGAPTGAPTALRRSAN